MRYPKIYSLSTVGILKHYVHDYLLHSERTDFIGANGVGKSIIADLLQLLFVYDANLIRFGTDGLNKRDRSIHTLPYKQPHAYCFINIELQENQFITIGILIPERNGSRIIPFVITADPDLNKDKAAIALSPAQLLFARDFITQNVIPDLKALAQKLYEQGLYVTFYRTKEEVKAYYQFLNIKNITPINLANEDNLKAFAKVIQSFSKAKSLDLNNSNSIKQFLFDDSDKDFVADYDVHKETLEKLLRQYEQLSAFIVQLTKKQGMLEQLDLLDKESEKLLKEFKKSEVIALSVLLAETKAEAFKEEQRYKNLKTEFGSLNSKIKRIPNLLAALEDKYRLADENEKLLTDFEQLENKLEEYDELINKLKVWAYINISHSTRGALGTYNIDKIDTDKIIDLATYAYPFLQKYTEWQAIENTYEDQQKAIQQISSKIDVKVNHHQKWIDLLENTDDTSIINWVLNRGLPLNQNQEAILIKYFDAGISKPDSPTHRDKYVRVPQFLDEAEITEDDHGFWLALGNLFQFVALDDKKSALAFNENKYDRQKLISEKKETIQLLEQQKIEIQKIKKNLPYDNQIITEDFDTELIEYANLNRIKEGLGYIADVGKKIIQLESQKKLGNEQLADLKLRMTGRIELIEGTDLRAELKDIKSIRLNWVKRISKEEGAMQEQLKETEKSLQHSQNLLEGYFQQIDKLNEDFIRLTEKYFQTYNENLSPEEIEPMAITPELAEQKYRQIRSDYERKYLETVSLFEDTKERRNISVNLELETRAFSFKSLEAALLGLQIHHTDQIGAALQQANLARLNIADNIRDNMVRIFNHTIRAYRRYEEIVKSINSFFKLRKISNRFVFKVDFDENKTLKIEYLQNLGAELINAYKRNEIPFGYPVSEFIEEFFKKAAKLPSAVKVNDLLNPKTYFDLRVSLTNENQGKTSGSTGETYSAIALLGIARLSLVESGQENGLRFIILEETGSLDNINFSTFPAVAKEYGYQIITMAPRPFGITLSDEWYLHYLIKGKIDEDINHFPTASFFYTKDQRMELQQYLKKQTPHELD